MPNQFKLPTGNVTFFFSDIQGSTPLWERILASSMEVSEIADRRDNRFRLLARQGRPGEQPGRGLSDIQRQP